MKYTFLLRAKTQILYITHYNLSNHFLSKVIELRVINWLKRITLFRPVQWIRVLLVNSNSKWLKCKNDQATQIISDLFINICICVLASVLAFCNLISPNITSLTIFRIYIFSFGQDGFIIEIKLNRKLFLFQNKPLRTTFGLLDHSE